MLLVEEKYLVYIKTQKQIVIVLFVVICYT